MMQETGFFLRQLLRNPREVSAIAPSSSALARAMVEGLGPDSGPVVEFGPGTGRMTRQILSRGVAPHDLTLFEMGAPFVEFLRKRHPDLRVVHGSAADVADHVAPGVARVVSSLPLLSIPDPVVEQIVAGAFRVLAPGGAMVQFTYGPVPPVKPEILDRLGLVARQTHRIPLNLPPARVFHLTRR